VGWGDDGDDEKVERSDDETGVWDGDVVFSAVDDLGECISLDSGMSPGWNFRVGMRSMSVGELANVMIAEGGGMAVTFPAYLAVFLGTLFPVAFLIILFIQSEARKAGEEAGRGE